MGPRRASKAMKDHLLYLTQPQNSFEESTIDVYYMCMGMAQ
jgi:hypothetical protein